MMALLAGPPAELSIRKACDALGVSRAAFYRARGQSDSDDQTPVVRRHPPRPPRRLADEERTKVIELLHSEEFRDKAPRQVIGTLLTRGEYMCSERTMYRILSSLGESVERRDQRRTVRHEPPFLLARAPNEVWVWDITALPGPRKGEFFYLYTVMDLYSRYIVAWQIAHVQCGAIAERLFYDACISWDIVPDSLCVHSDRGTPMTSHRLTRMFEQLGVAISYSRPRVSDDNAHMESFYKTTKYHPHFPDRFPAFGAAMAWAQQYVPDYNLHHIHSSLADFTPANVFFDKVDEIVVVRQATFDRAYAAHPERFVNGPPQAKRPPEQVTINPADLVDPDDPEYLNASPTVPTRRANSKSRPSSPQIMLPIS
jgi:putative transposase